MILAFILLLLLIGLGGLWGLAIYESAHAEALQAQALLTANQTTQVSVVGQTALSLVVVVLALALLGGVVFGLLFFKRWQSQQTARPGQWVSGPNAHWQRKDQIPSSPQAALGTSPQELLMLQQQFQAQVFALWMMREMSGKRPSDVISLPAPSNQLPDDDDDEIPWWG